MLSTRWPERTSGPVAPVEGLPLIVRLLGDEPRH